jgi:hypothetical protein
MWEDVSGFASQAHPKVAPVLNVVGEAESREAIQKCWYTHALADLEVARTDGRRQRISWHTPIPFHTGGSKDVQIHEISPPIPLKGAGIDRRIEVSHLEASLHGRINRVLKNDASLDDQGNYRAPVAATIWEAVFDPESRQFWPHSGVR